MTMGVFSFPFSSIRESSSFMQEQIEKPLRGWQRLIDAYSFFNSECSVKIKATSADHGIQ